MSERVERVADHWIFMAATEEIPYEHIIIPIDHPHALAPILPLSECECERCEGGGEIEQSYSFGTSADKGDGGFVECPDCDGTGRGARRFVVLDAKARTEVIRLLRKMEAELKRDDETHGYDEWFARIATALLGEGWRVGEAVGELDDIEGLGPILVAAGMPQALALDIGDELALLTPLPEGE